MVGAGAPAGARTPAWTSNLPAHPEATVAIGGAEVPVRAGLLEGPDRDEALAPARRTFSPGRFAPARRTFSPGRFAPARRTFSPGRFAPARRQRM